MTVSCIKPVNEGIIMKRAKNNNRILDDFVRKTDAAMCKMISDVIEEHRRLNMPLVVSQNGKVAYVPADKLLPAVREPRSKYVTKKKK